MCKISVESIEEEDYRWFVMAAGSWQTPWLWTGSATMGELVHPGGPAANVQPKRGRRDVGFCPITGKRYSYAGLETDLPASGYREGSRLQNLSG